VTGVQTCALPISVFSAADEEGDIVVHGIEALHLWSDDQTLPEPSPIRAVLEQESVREALARGAFLVRIPLIEDEARTVRANITMDAGMLRAIDDIAKRRGLTRSAFLADCARREIETTA